MAHAFGEDQHAVRQYSTTNIAGGRANGSSFWAERLDRGSRSGHGAP